MRAGLMRSLLPFGLLAALLEPFLLLLLSLLLLVLLLPEDAPQTLLRAPCRVVLTVPDFLSDPAGVLDVCLANVTSVLLLTL